MDEGAKRAKPIRSNSFRGERRTVRKAGLGMLSGIRRARRRRATEPPEGRLM